MRVAYVCRDLATDSATGPGAHAFAAANAMALAGHEVHLISEELAAPWRQLLPGISRLNWQPLLPERVAHLYFTERQSYADRVYDTVQAVHDETGLDVIELPDAGGEALTLLRAKRLLARFPNTRLAVSLQPWSTIRLGPTAHQPTEYTAELTAYAEQYARSHADIVLAATQADADTAGVHSGQLRRCLPSLPYPDSTPPGGFAPDAARTVLWLGPIRPDAGLETVLHALELAHEKEPELRLVLRGADTPTDPVGRSYWQHLQGQLTGSLRGAVTLAGPLRIAELAALPPAGTQCVLATGVSGTPSEALVAMAAGYVVAAPMGSVGAGLICDNETGRIVPDRNPQALADVLVAAVRGHATGAGLARAAADAMRNQYTPLRAAECLTEAYVSTPVRVAARWSARPAARADRVSVVIPVYNQGRFLASAVDSVRRGGPAELDIVVVDDGSTEPETVAALDALTDVNAVRQAHRGLSAARNAGIERARGPLILVLDADDMVQPGFLPAAVDALRRRDDLGFLGGYVRYFGLLNLVYVPAGLVGDLNLVLHTHLKSMVLFRRQALQHVGGYDESLPAFEDWEIQIRLARAGYDSDVLPLEGQLYRRHAESMSFSISNGMRTELVQYLVRKHADAMTAPQLTALLQQLVNLWKSGYEPSTSVLLQRAQGGKE
ncbi:glycosyltransferase [Streptomyces sp. NPDC046900]|uniref:glycosyltransferase n=1 Tax=Streptomyces sp. NPDC046900 TaxID=3155473 RepID=UPI0033D6AAFD